MSPLPLPIRLAAGLAAIALERARKLPQDVSEWPMTAVSQALQVSMRVQQRITELAIKGDEALASLHETQEHPPWAVFDEDLPEPSYLRPETNEAPAAQLDDEVDGYDLAAQDLTTAEEQTWFEAIDEVYEQPAAAGAPDAEQPPEQAAIPEPADQPNAPTPADQPDAATPADQPTGAAGSARGTAAAGVPVVLPSYPGLTLASVRGRLRVLSVGDLEELLAYERGHADRPEFVRLLTNRIATVRGR